MEIDNLDKKIIYTIDLNPRIPLSSLAKKLRINRNTLEYRLNILLKKGIIKNFFAVINGSKFGFKYYKYLIKVYKISKSFSLNKLFKEEEIIWIGKTDGYWDFAITLRAKDQLSLNKIINIINSLFDIKEKIILPINKASIFNERWLTNTKEIRAINNEFYNEVSQEQDENDQKIIKILSNNAKESLVNIGLKIKLTPEAISKRIKNLEKSKIILGYKARINYSLLGYDYYHIFLSIKENNLKKEIINFLKGFNNCITTLDFLGRYDIQAEFIVNSYKNVRGIVDKLKETFPDQIQEIERLFIIEESEIKTY